MSVASYFHSKSDYMQCKPFYNGINDQILLPAPVTSRRTIHELDIDCCHELFDYLSLDDLVSIGNTCKRMQFAVGNFIEHYYMAKRKTYENNGITMGWFPRKVSTFSRNFQKISISGAYENLFEYIGTHCSKMLKEIRIAQTDLTSGDIEHIKHILTGAKMVQLDQCRIDGEFYETFLQFCCNLKSLSVSRSSFDLDNGTIIGNGNDWLHRSYATLEHLELTDLYEFKRNELNTFFAQNPNLRSFSTDAKSLLMNRDMFMASGAKLDKITIDFHHLDVRDPEVLPSFVVNSLHNLLSELHGRGFYKELHLYITFSDFLNCTQKLFTLIALTMLGGYIAQIDDSPMALRELDINRGSDVSDLHKLPSKLPNLERIHFSEAASDHILPFIFGLPKLKYMKIEELSEGLYLKDGVLDLMTLERERMKLGRARKLVIYVNEPIFVATKWASPEMSFQYIELRRGESVEWNEFNARYRFVQSF